MKKSLLMCAIITILVTLSFCVIASAYEITPYADTEFDSASTYLKASKQVSFRAVTYNVKSSISVTACWLEQKNDDGSWTTICSLAAPSVVSQNDFSYSATMDYSSEIGAGTYRIRATYNADDHTITRYSNERTFSN